MLCVIKDCGPEGEGLLSFPKAGHLHRARHPGHERTRRRWSTRSNELVIAEGGRIYLAKDAFTRAEHFRAMEPRLAGLARPSGASGTRRARIRSAQSVRLLRRRRREGRVPRRHQGHGPRPGAPHGRSAATAVPARPRRRPTSSAARATSRCAAARRRVGQRALRSRAARELRTRARRRGGRARRPRHRGRHRRRSSPPRTRSRPIAELARRAAHASTSRTPSSFCEEARRRLLARGGGTLCVFSSVAGERGRKPVVLYGAAKAGLTRYLEGLDHRFRAPGPADGLRQARLRADLDDRRVCRRRRSRASRRTWRGACCAPSTPARPSSTPRRSWRWVMLVIRLLPRFVMRRVGF